MGTPIMHGAKTQREKVLPKGKLLLVDDNVKELRHYRAVFDEAGYEVRAFSSYGEAAACLEREMFDMVVVKPGGVRL